MMLSRRHFLKNAAAMALIAGGLHSPLLGGLLRVPPAAAQELPDFPEGFGQSKRVAVIGAGIAGLTSAYELLKAGFDVTVFEGQKRYGGRSLTVRPSDADYRAWYLDHNPFVKADSYCDFVPAEVRGARVGELVSQFTPYRVGDDYFDLYLNCGPGRIPTHHTGVLHYCRSFGVPMEPFIFTGDSNLMQAEDLNGGKPVQMRRFQYDLQGYFAAMLYATADKALPSGVAAADPSAVTKLRELLTMFGDLSPDGAFQNTSRAGYAIDPGAGTNAGLLHEPLALDELLNAGDLWPELYLGERYMWQFPLLQPVGGMDMVWQAFLAQEVAGAELRERVHLEHDVTGLTYADDGGSTVSVGYNSPDGSGRETFDYVVVTSSPHVIDGMNLDGLLASGVADMLRSIVYGFSGKYGWQARRRFWEDQDVQIFGGISWTTQEIKQIWYPSDGYHGPTGILTGAYMYDMYATDMDGQVYDADSDYRTALDPDTVPASDRPAFLWGELDHAGRTKLALQGGELLHPGFTENVYAEEGLSVSWNNQPYQYGLQVFDMVTTRPEAYARLIQPIDKSGRVYMAGDGLSYWSGWQEGAVRSAWWTLGLLRDHVESQR